jgi:CxxC motif-containing protein (DUF1111 family)
MQKLKRLLLIVLLIPALACHRSIKTPIIVPPPGLIEALTGFDNNTNGLVNQQRHDDDRDQFEEDAGPEIGPLFNHRSCVDCHSNPITGANSQVFEHRLADGTLIHDQAVGVPQQVAPAGAFNALRSSVNLMGDGLVEAVPDSLLKYIASVNGGKFIEVPVLESPGVTHVGRFGHKDQHASLLSFAGDADFNEKGVCNRLVSGSTGCASPVIEDPEPTCGDGGEDIDCYARFMRALKAPPRGTITPQVQAGEEVFNRIGCASCHVSTLYTDRFVFHPFGDFLLHDLGTGDGVQQGSVDGNHIRTAPLWGLRVKSHFLHDGRAFDVVAAINAHKHEAAKPASDFQQLNSVDKDAILAFLNSL